MLVVAALGATAGCAGEDEPSTVYGATPAKIGETVAVLGWNMSVTNLRWDSDYVLVDVDAAPSEAGKPHAKVESIRFGMYGALAHPIEATGLGSCANVASLAFRPLAAPNPDRLTGTVCLGPLQEQSAVRGVYVYSPEDRIAGTVVAYPALFPFGVAPVNSSDTGLSVENTSVEAWREDGTPLSQASLGDPNLLPGNGYMLLGLRFSAAVAQYRDNSAARGGPLMVTVAPSLPGRGLNPPCAAYGASVLVLPDASLDAVQVSASLCTQGEISRAVLRATLSVIGTHAAVWTTRE